MCRTLSLGLAAFCLGFLVGAVAVNLLLGYQVDELTLARQELQAQLKAAREELAEVKEKLASHQRHLITAVEAHVALEGDFPSDYEAESTRLQLAEKARGLLLPWRGREARSVDPLAIKQIFSGRLLEAGDQVFRLEVNLVVVTERLSVYLTARPR